MATATRTAEVLDTYGSLHVCQVGNESVVVHDCGKHFECIGRESEPYKLYHRNGKIMGCTCAAAKYNRVCKHRLAAQAVLAAW